MDVSVCDIFASENISLAETSFGENNPTQQMRTVVSNAIFFIKVFNFI
jgi:hypothetical protein